MWLPFGPGLSFGHDFCTLYAYDKERHLLLPWGGLNFHKTVQIITMLTHQFMWMLISPQGGLQ